ncbi:MAG: type II toxin-antitoxin system RelB/DinJ family antitoxin [Gracilibacteraceae bacterium]|jgi:DNA-damage-inducible protein J|nr:type II toxin-antitoxin system RelB/DinJ family antitoxin [Gracilibacteraceae bacterium]
MEKAANIYVRVKPEIKAQAEQVFDGFGMTISEAVNIFLHKAIMVGGIPFDVRPSVPNAETLAAMREVEQMEKDQSIGKGYTDVKQMMEELLAKP